MIYRWQVPAGIPELVLVAENEAEWAMIVLYTNALTRNTARVGIALAEKRADADAGAGRDAVGAYVEEIAALRDEIQAAKRRESEYRTALLDLQSWFNGTDVYFTALQRARDLLERDGVLITEGA